MGMSDNEVRVTWSFGEKDDGAYVYLISGDNKIAMTTSMARVIVGQLLDYIREAELHNLSVNAFNSARIRPAKKLDIIKNFVRDLFE